MTTDQPQQPQRSAPRRRTGLRYLRWSAILVTVIAIAIGAVFGARLKRDPTLVTTPLIGTQAPSRELPYLERAGTLSLDKLRGNLVVVNFWASWCVACRKEHPDLLAAASAYRGAGVKFVGIVYQDRAAGAKAFLDELGRGRDYLYLTDPGSRMAIDFGVFGVPETFFLDRNGRIAAKISGASTLPLVSSVLDDLIAGNPPEPSTKAGPVQPAPGK